ncbi:MAG TPA: FixH family protein [Terriglobales bacterium]|nr:FixH family protein [Terriglobales bacterium]
MELTRRIPKWNPWPVSIIAFFTIAMTGCVTFIIFCNRHPADLVAADYYEQEVRYQGQIDRLQAARQEAASSAVSYDAQRRLILVSVPSGISGATLSGTIQLYRPSAMNQDRSIPFQPDAKGAQNIDASSLTPGLWKVRVSWKVAEQEYLLDQPVVITSARS